MSFVRLNQTRQFTVEKYNGKAWKMWDPDEKKMLVSETWREGYQQRFSFETEQGTLELSRSQFGECLTAAYPEDIIGRTFQVKTNGRLGKDIRYFFNIQPKDAVKPSYEPEEAMQEDYSNEQIPF